MVTSRAFMQCQKSCLVPPSKFSLLMGSQTAKEDEDSHLLLASVSGCKKQAKFWSTNTGPQRTWVYKELTLGSSSANIHFACVACRLNTIDTPGSKHLQRTCPQHTPRRFQNKGFAVQSPVDTARRDAGTFHGTASKALPQAQHTGTCTHTEIS